MSFDLEKIRSDFPILKRKINGYNFIYFDNAATSQKPNIVIDSISDYYKKSVRLVIFFLKINKFKKTGMTKFIKA